MDLRGPWHTEIKTTLYLFGIDAYQTKNPYWKFLVRILVPLHPYKRQDVRKWEEMWELGHIHELWCLWEPFFSPQGHSIAPMSPWRHPVQTAGMSAYVHLLREWSVCLPPQSGCTVLHEAVVAPESTMGYRACKIYSIWYTEAICIWTGI